MNTCICEKGQDGQCEPCKEAMGLFFNGLVELQKAYCEKIDQLKELHDPAEVCPDCKAMYADVVMTKFFGMVLGQIPERALAIQLYLYSVHVAQTFGAKATPHLDKVWSEICASNGWDPTAG